MDFALIVFIIGVTVSIVIYIYFIIAIMKISKPKHLIQDTDKDYDFSGEIEDPEIKDKVLFINPLNKNITQGEIIEIYYKCSILLYVIEFSSYLNMKSIVYLNRREFTLVGRG